jgi:uncharacterized UPF0160 family protein
MRGLAVSGPNDCSGIVDGILARQKELSDMENVSATDSTNVERKIATKLWPQHAEICSEQDWTVIGKAVKEGRPLSKTVVEPIGEAKDAILASLMILYWTMKIAQLGMQISKEVSHVPKPQRAKAILDAIAKRMDPDTPKIVAGRITEIVDNLESK